MAKTTKSKAKKVIGTKPVSKGKGATIVALLRRKEGATLADLTKATGWQPHSVRGFLSAQVGRNWGSSWNPPKARTANESTGSNRKFTQPVNLLPPGTLLAASCVDRLDPSAL